MSKNLDNMVIPVNKSAGLSTYDVIRRFRRAVKVRKVGHSGTLDPPATGLVLLLTGRATKLSNYLMDLPKRYVATIRLGEATDTQDGEGEVVRSGDWSHVSPSSIEGILPEFTGKRMQVPPMYSALKRNGKPLYTLARKGQEVERQAREVDIYDLVLTGCELPRFTIDIYCSRGMYVRVLAEELGERLGVPAHLAGLIRTRIGHFDLNSAVPDDRLDELDLVESHACAPVDALVHLPEIRLSAQQAKELGSGSIPRNVGPLRGPAGYIRLIRPDGTLGGIAEFKGTGLLSLRRVFERPE